MSEKMFDTIQSRYGVSKSALEDAWEKTSNASDFESRVKMFKSYMHQLTGEGHYNYSLSESSSKVQVPAFDKDLAESVARIFLQEEFNLLQDYVAELNK